MKLQEQGGCCREEVKKLACFDYFLESLTSLRAEKDRDTKYNYVH